ncbi:MAG: ferredoxin, partial [Bacteroidetes bacterium]|nr:ferredoxin [Pseudomonadota bacterium]MBU1580890.1 ferredoxin [Bacteroidota bacterium]
CVDACPVADTLDVKSLITKKKISKPKIAIGIAIIYLIVISIGMFTGNWESKATKEDYLLYYQNLDRIGHPTSVQDIETLNKVSEKEKADGRKQNK